MPLTPTPNRTPYTKCNPSNPGPANARLQIYVTSTSNKITVNEIRSACGQSFSRQFNITRTDNETYTFPDDLHPTTLAMLDGIARRFDRFAQYGFDREP